MKQVSLLALGLALLFSFSAAAQQSSSSPQPTPTPPPKPQPSATVEGRPAPGDDDVVRITTNLVQVDAVITDKDGKPVTDLRPEEIRIFEDKRSQNITHFSYVVTDSTNLVPPTKSAVAVRNAVPGPPVTLRPEQVRRTMALIVDDLGLSFESTYFVRRALKKFVDEQMQSGDLVAIIRTSGGLGALQQFTADKRQLYAAIERVKWYANGRAGASAFAPISGNSSQSAEAEAANEEFDQFRADHFAVGTLGAVSYVVRGLAELPGRKSVLLISDGFKINVANDPDRTARTLAALQHLVDQSSRASVVIYTMNASGLQTLAMTAADDTGHLNPDQIEDQLKTRRNAAFDSQEGLSYLAERTGGIAIQNNNDLSAGMKRVIEDQKGYYLIGYRPDESTFDRATGRHIFHKLDLKVLRPGKFKIRIRSGFFGVSDDEARPAPVTSQQQISKALSSPFGSAGVHVRLTSLFGNEPKLGSLMRSMMHVDAADLTFADEPDDWHKAVFDSRDLRR
jgi:VWFA-related protein